MWYESKLIRKEVTSQNDYMVKTTSSPRTRKARLSEVNKLRTNSVLYLQIRIYSLIVRLNVPGYYGKYQTLKRPSTNTDIVIISHWLGYTIKFDYTNSHWVGFRTISRI